VPRAGVYSAARVDSPRSGFMLSLLASLLVALLLLAAVAVPAGRRPMGGAIVFGGAAIICLALVIIALVALLGGGSAAPLVLPIGPPWAAMRLALDGLSAWFLLLLGLAGGAASLFALGEGDAAPRTLPPYPLFLAGMGVTLAAADGFTLLLGFELMSLASFALVMTYHHDAASRSAGLLYLGMATLGAVCLMGAMALLGQSALSFAAMRAHPPEGWRATVILLLVLVGAGSKAGLAPLHVWLPPAHAAAPGHVSALMSGAMTKVALYVLIRVIFDLCGPSQPMWWGVPLILLGAAGAVIGGLRANMETDIKAVLACSTVENIGLICIGLGLGFAARAVDLAPLAALALGGALLHAVAHGIFKSLLFLAAGATQHGAGTRQLDRLGGLITRMPVTTACILAGGACLAALPPSSGFAGEWMLFQAGMAAPRIGGLGWQILVTGAVAVMALAAALAAAATVRLIGVAYLGRPRSPRAAAAEEASFPERFAMIGLAGLCLAIGVFPGVVLALIGPGLRLLSGADASLRLAGLVVVPATDAPGLSGLSILMLLALLGAGCFWAIRRFAVQGHRSGPAWDCGFGAAPAWLPFGDPVTQYAGESFAQPLRRALGVTILGSREHVDMPEPGEIRAASIAVHIADPADVLLFGPVAVLRDRLSGIADRMQFLTVRRTLAVMFTVLVLFLAVVAVMEQL
jgi:formate hydrogenlyase subunit 3/multisubunit Na+/H+ antiporter MnhD subunit